MEYQTYETENVSYLVVPPASAGMPPLKGRFGPLWEMARQNDIVLMPIPIRQYSNWREAAGIDWQLEPEAAEWAAIKDSGYEGPVTVAFGPGYRFGVKVIPRAEHPADYAELLAMAFAGEDKATVFFVTESEGWESRLEAAQAELCPGQDVATVE